MKTESIEDKVKVLVEPVLIELGIELVNVVYTAERGGRVLRIFIDKPDGVTLDDCSRVSRELGTILDVEDVIGRSYSLEVSSPGLDRPLIKEKDFIRAIGKQIRITVKQDLEGRRNFKGVTLEDVRDGKLIVTDGEGKKWDIEVSNVEKARQEAVI